MKGIHRDAVPPVVEVDFLGRPLRCEAGRHLFHPSAVTVVYEDEIQKRETLLD